MDKQNIEKRQRILAAAVDLFRRAHDVRRVSLETIAKEAGVSPTTIYNHFGNRETLVNEVAKKLVKEIVERNRALIRSELPFPKKIISVISGKLDMVGKVSSEILQKMVSQDQNIVPFINEIMEQEVKPLWLEMVADGKKEGYIDPTLDDGLLLAYLDVLQAGFRAKPEILEDIADNVEFLEQLTHLMFRGILQKDIDLFPKEDK